MPLACKEIDLPLLGQDPHVTLIDPSIKENLQEGHSKDGIYLKNPLISDAIIARNVIYLGRIIWDTKGWTQVG